VGYLKETKVVIFGKIYLFFSLKNGKKIDGNLLKFLENYGVLKIVENFV
jgi:hypothetical protein